MNQQEAWEGFAKAIEGNPFVTLAELMSDVDEGRATVFSGAKAAVLVRWDFECGVAHCGPETGDPDEVIYELRPLIEQVCSEVGIKEMHIQAGRQAWSRLLREYGYEEAAVILRKVLH